MITDQLVNSLARLLPFSDELRSPTEVVEHHPSVGGRQFLKEIGDMTLCRKQLGPEQAPYGRHSICERWLNLRVPRSPGDTRPVPPHVFGIGYGDQAEQPQQARGRTQHG
ncbi:MAG TPA: hypothetical protein VM223_14990, partial [Planctomycetota bacterium]|nr:hypothetical protein [Planctomycetota bacterium]